MKMVTGLSAGILWALDTVILGIALSALPFIKNEQAFFLAPFASTFLHDACSAVYLLFLMGIKKQYRKLAEVLAARSGRIIILGAIFGGPVGMTGYVLAIQYLGASYTAMFSALFPALGAFLSFLFLKERMSKLQMAGLVLSVGGMVAQGYMVKGQTPGQFGLGLFFAMLCVTGWAVEIVICAYGMKKSGIAYEQALTIRQVTSAVVYGGIILNLVDGFGLVREALETRTAGVIAAAAVCGTLSYLCYYKTIGRLGPSKAMALNITYCAWGMVFEFVLLARHPAAGGVLCALLILTGAILTATGGREEKEEGKG